MNELQHTAAWHQQRLGIPTASSIWKVLQRGRGGAPSLTRARYMAELIAARRATDEEPIVPVFDRPMPFEVQWGLFHEDEARSRYTLKTGNAVEPAPFIRHPRLDSGASPDGLLGTDGVLEIKCPTQATHLRHLEGVIADEYRFQVQWQLACSQRQFAEFVSFDPRWRRDEMLHVQRIERDNELISTMEQAVAEFLDELEEHCIRLDRLAEQRRAA